MILQLSCISYLYFDFDVVYVKFYWLSIILVYATLCLIQNLSQFTPTFAYFFLQNLKKKTKKKLWTPKMNLMANSAQLRVHQ